MSLLHPITPVVEIPNDRSIRRVMKRFKFEFNPNVRVTLYPSGVLGVATSWLADDDRFRHGTLDVISGCDHEESVWLSFPQIEQAFEDELFYLSVGIRSKCRMRYHTKWVNSSRWAAEVFFVPDDWEDSSRLLHDGPFGKTIKPK